MPFCFDDESAPDAGVAEVAGAAAAGEAGAVIAGLDADALVVGDETDAGACQRPGEEDLSVSS